MSAQFKLVLLGESSVGKSSIVQRFVKDSFTEARESTIGAAFLTHSVKLTPQTAVLDLQNAEEATPKPPAAEVNVKYEIWDTAGQERYRSLASMYYRNAQTALIVYDVTSQKSLEQAKYWIKELKRQVNDNMVVILVGNKLDLLDDRDNIETDALAQELKDTYGLLWTKVSAKTGEGVHSLFEQLALRLPYEEQLQKQNARNKKGLNSGRVNLNNGGSNNGNNRDQLGAADCAC